MIYRGSSIFTNPDKWNVMCNRCGLLLADDHGLVLCNDPQEAAKAAESQGWLIQSISQALCPSCQEQKGGSHE